MLYTYVCMHTLRFQLFKSIHTTGSLAIRHGWSGRRDGSTLSRVPWEPALRVEWSSRPRNDSPGNLRPFWTLTGCDPHFNLVELLNSTPKSTACPGASVLSCCIVSIFCGGHSSTVAGDHIDCLVLFRVFWMKWSPEDGLKGNVGLFVKYGNNHYFGFVWHLENAAVRYGFRVCNAMSVCIHV